jgi:hypothetical protein
VLQETLASIISAKAQIAGLISPVTEVSFEIVAKRLPLPEHNAP